VLTKYCQRCANAKDSKKLKEHQESHACNIKFQGVSGGMEAVGAVAIFTRSVDMHGARYTKYLGDGDSKGFMKAVEVRPYGETEVEKLECTGYVQKRMGTHLHKLRKELMGKKLEDGKSLAGRGRLTDKEIDNLQNYYGMAIRRNTDSEEKMKQNVWAIYFHKISTDSEPHHGLCPKGETS
jgi:hypothetical protein